MDSTEMKAIQELTEFLATKTQLATRAPGIADSIALRLFEAGWRKQDPICGARVYPYTEHNICVSPPHSSGLHTDDKGRSFDHAEYVRGGEE